MKYVIDHERGEMSLTLGEETYQMRLSHEALARIKADFDGEKTIEICTRRLISGYDEEDLAVIIGRSCGREDFAAIADQVLREGIANVVNPVREYFILTLNGFKKPHGQQKKSREKTSTRSGAS